MPSSRKPHRGAPIPHGIPTERTSDLWWRNAVIYCLDVETFLDSDGDGVGDFQGRVQRVDYVAALGASAVWLMPFYESPGRDDGYDIFAEGDAPPRTARTLEATLPAYSYRWYRLRR